MSGYPIDMSLYDFKTLRRNSPYFVAKGSSSWRISVDLPVILKNLVDPLLSSSKTLRRSSPYLLRTSSYTISNMHQVSEALRIPERNTRKAFPFIRKSAQKMFVSSIMFMVEVSGVARSAVKIVVSDPMPARDHPLAFWADGATTAYELGAL